MKLWIIILLIQGLWLNTTAQHVSKITLTQTGNLQFITLNLDEDVIVNVSPEGNIVEWGIDIYRNRDYSWNKLETYTGRTDTFRINDDSSLRGKLKIIGRTQIRYFASYEDEILQGKIKSIGAVNFEYFPKYENEAFKGKLKQAGPLSFTFYPAFGKSDDQGKLKSAGNTILTYFSAFDDKSYKGKLKSLGAFSFQYYGSSELTHLRGHLKKGNYTQAVNGIKFVIK